MTNPWNAPVDQDPLALETLSNRTEGAGFGIRAGARILDSMAGAFVGGVVGGVVGVVAGLSGLDVSNLDEFQLAPFVGGLFSAVVAPAVSERLAGVTLGKWVCGLRVVNLDGGTIPLGQGLGRNLAFYIDSLFFALPAYVSMSDNLLCQRLGDKWAGTAVLRVADTPGRSRSPLVAVAIAVVAGLGVRALVDAIALMLHWTG